jgi:RNA polymerase sigma-70 factor (ECF subfamily)
LLLSVHEAEHPQTNFLLLSKIGHFRCPHFPRASYIKIRQKRRIRAIVLSDSPAPQTQKGLPSFDTLYAQYSTHIYRYFFAHLKHEDDAADLTQQVFLQAWKQRHTYNAQRGTPATWLFGIAQYRLIDFHRTTHPAVSWEQMGDNIAPEQTPEEALIHRETFQQIRTMIESLAPTDREMLILRFAARLPSAEIARIVGKSEAATKRQLSRILSRLQQQCQYCILQDRRHEMDELAMPPIAGTLFHIYSQPLPVRLQQRPSPEETSQSAPRQRQARTQPSKQTGYPEQKCMLLLSSRRPS